MKKKRSADAIIDAILNEPEPRDPPEEDEADGAAGAQPQQTRTQALCRYVSDFLVDALYHFFRAQLRADAKEAAETLRVICTRDGGGAAGAAAAAAGSAAAAFGAAGLSSALAAASLTVEITEEEARLVSSAAQALVDSLARSGIAVDAALAAQATGKPPPAPTPAEGEDAGAPTDEQAEAAAEEQGGAAAAAAAGAGAAGAGGGAAGGAPHNKGGRKRGRGQRGGAAALQEGAAAAAPDSPRRLLRSNVSADRLRSAEEEALRLMTEAQLRRHLTAHFAMKLHRTLTREHLLRLAKEELDKKFAAEGGEMGGAVLLGGGGGTLAERRGRREVKTPAAFAEFEMVGGAGAGGGSASKRSRKG